MRVPSHPGKSRNVKASFPIMGKKIYERKKNTNGYLGDDPGKSDGYRWIISKVTSKEQLSYVPKTSTGGAKLIHQHI